MIWRAGIHPQVTCRAPKRLAHVACSTLLRVDAEVPSGGAAAGEPNRWLLTGGGAVQLVEGWQSL